MTPNEHKAVQLNSISAGARRDERALWTLVVVSGLTPRAAGDLLDMHTKRVAYLCQKWARVGIYDYGVTVDLGQPTTVARFPTRPNR